MTTKPEILEATDEDFAEPPPAPPPPRTFLVKVRPAMDATGLPAGPESHIVDAHQVELSTHGDLLFFLYGVIATPQGYQANPRLKRAFAAGEWKDVEELTLTVPGLLVH